MAQYDIIIIGSGPGGYVAAIRAAQLGKKVAVVERAELGGVCLNWGCIPTKALLKSAQVYSSVSRAASYGIDISGDVKPDMGKIVARSREVAQTMSKGVDFLMKKNGIDVIYGSGKLLGDGRVGVTSENGDTEFKAPHIILATGARQREIPALPIDGKYILNSRQAISLTKLPGSVVVVGSGAIGCEFAYYYAALGSKVTLVEYLPNIMPTEDEEVSKYMERSFRKMRVTVMVGTGVQGVQIEGEKCKVDVDSKKGVQTIEAAVVISAVGIKSNIDNIGAEELGLAVERDRVVVDKFYQTSIPGIYAIGDIVPGPALAHVASAEAVCCVEKICGLDPETIDYSAIPAGIYISPEVASVGMTEEEAVKKGLEIKIGRFPLTASGRATAEGERDGFAKLIFDAKSQKLLGAHLVGPNVTEMIAEATLVQKQGITADTLARTIHPHPTISEALMEAAEEAFGQAIHL